MTDHGAEGELRREKQEHEKLLTELREYAQHKPGCGANICAECGFSRLNCQGLHRALVWTSQGCSCGLDRVLADLRSQQEGEKAPRLEITYERGGKFWHTNCPKSPSGIMAPVAYESDRSLIKCMHCGQRGYYPVGSVGTICADALQANANE